MERCSDCNSDACIPWDTGYICQDCGTEFGNNHFPKALREVDDESE